MRAHRGEKPYQCSECGAEFFQSGHLMIHKRVHTGEKPYTCDICLVQFKQISHLKTHARTHTQEKPYKCDVCDAAFAQNSSLKRHKRSHTGEKPYTCEQCGMSFVVKSNLQRHSFTHTGEKPYSCNLCSASFGQLIDLRRHKISHTGIKHYKCDECEASFSRKNNLKWHMYTHAEGATYKCDTCNVYFSTPGDLRFHKRSHEPPKPYQCNVCPASFQQICSLKNHELIHTSEFPAIKKLKNKAKGSSNNSVPCNSKSSNSNKPYSCPYCDSSFCEKRNYRRHLISMHPDNMTSNKKDLTDQVDDKCVFKSSVVKLKEEEPKIITSGELGQLTVGYNNGQSIEVSPSSHVILGEALSTNNGLQIVPSVINQGYTPLLIQGLAADTANNATIVNGSQMGVGTVVVNNTSFVNISGSSPTSEKQYNATPITTTTAAVPATSLLNQLIITTGPDQPAKQAKPAGSCPNHSSHILTLVDQTSNHWQAWCLCDSTSSPPLASTTTVATPAQVARGGAGGSGGSTVTMLQSPIVINTLPVNAPAPNTIIGNSNGESTLDEVSSGEVTFPPPGSIITNSGSSAGGAIMLVQSVGATAPNNSTRNPQVLTAGTASAVW